MPNILIIDDDPQVCKTLVHRFERLSFDVQFAMTLAEGMEEVFTDNYDVVFLDINLPDGNGLDAIPKIKSHPLPPEVIIMTGATDIEGAALAIKARAWDYIEKSGSYKEFQLSLSRAIEYRKQKKFSHSTQQLQREAIIGQSQPMQECIKQVAKASITDAPVLLTGETGTGKELVSKAIHDNSHRKDSDFIVVDCAALPEHLVESVLFGHTRGAFTGADSDKTGLIRLADGGTLFLDEVGELPLSIQKKFLRALQEKKFRPVGSKKEVSSNFRLIAATHRDVQHMVEEKRFREDFYYRIASIKIEIPPLRKRKSDIPLLINYHIQRKCKLMDQAVHDFSDEFMEHLRQYDWPGNIRELFNAVDYACSDAFQEEMLFARNLPDHIRVFNIQKKIKGLESQEKHIPAFSTAIPVNTFGFKDYIETIKRQYIIDLISHTKGDIKSACQLSGLSRGHLYSLFKKYQISSH